MKRLSQLDGIRGAAMFLVLIWHYFCCQVHPVPGSALDYCVRALFYSWTGVDLFFVLSGFLIAGILLDHHKSSNYFRIFYLRRVCRIFPLYYLVLGLFVCFSATTMSTSPAFEWLFARPMPIGSYATFTQNLFMGHRGYFGAQWLGLTWSVAVEEQFYLVVPLLIYFLPRRPLFCVLLTGVLAAPVLRQLSPGFHTYVGAPWRADDLLSGACLALLVRSHSFIGVVRRNHRSLLALFLILLAGAGAITWRHARLTALIPFWFAGLYTVFVLIAFADTQPLIGRVLRFQPLVWFGQRSYGFYLFHEIVDGLCHGLIRHATREMRTLSDAAVTLLALLITLLLATLSYRFFERPILHFGHKFPYRSKPESELPSQSVTG
jgi:peptidoglycan/LPS O-acetylase OafA/YrhL